MTRDISANQPDRPDGDRNDRQGPGQRKQRALGGPLVVVGILGMMASLTFGAVVLPTLALGERPPEMPVYGTMPAFQLQDQTGASITEEALRGHVVVVNFIFTRCPVVCPVFSMKMRRIQDRTEDMGDMLKLVSFSVDPDYDTPEVLAAYAEEHGADPARWRFLTGASDDIRGIATDGLMMAMDRDGTLPDGVPNMIHGEHFVLLDHALQIRGYYSSNDAKRLERMLRDARRLEREAREAREARATRQGTKE